MPAQPDRPFRRAYFAGSTGDCIHDKSIWIILAEEKLTMKIERIRAYRVVLHTTEGRYAWGKDHFVDELDSTIIRIDTDAGINGFGEICCPMASGYTPFFAAGARAGTAEVARPL